MGKDELTEWASAATLESESDLTGIREDGQGQKLVLPFLCLFEAEIINSTSSLGVKTHRYKKVSTPS